MALTLFFHSFDSTCRNNLAESKFFHNFVPKITEIMKLKYDFAVRQVCGIWAAVPVGESARRYHGVINLNETAADMMGFLKEEITEEELVQKMLTEYDAPESDMRRDVAAFIAQLQAEKLLC